MNLLKRVTVYHSIAIFLAVLTFVNSLKLGFNNTLPQIFIAVLTCSLLDLLVKRLRHNRWTFPLTAVITGFFIGTVLETNLKWYILIIAAVAAIASKHFITFKHRPVFNPANLGILFASVFFSTTYNWWASTPLWLVVLFGSIITYQLRNYYLVISYLIAHIIFFGAYALIIKSPIIPQLFLINFFFVFFMLAEPKTSPINLKGKVIFGVLVALFYLIFGITVPEHNIILALAVGNVCVPFINKFTVRISHND